MKKYLLFLITLLSISLTSCSTDDDFCGNGFQRVDQLGRGTNGMYPEDLIVPSIIGESFIVITSERDFLRDVKDAKYFIGQVDFRYENLLIGQAYIKGFRGNIPSTTALFKESCKYNRRNEVIITLDVNSGSVYEHRTYNAILPKTSNIDPNVQVDIMYR
ncbi:hypothetical protein [Myroides odoratimimus]|uniref:Lipoprotein n=1 Tax=Myroides odoratimimus TaxID=76832 RepID=A0AAI8G3Z4_9FLAO|nr:hypothetical protein [Myroides odoratimimus]ALU25415.1 hypothetical protein AS202_04265 [Myroides odoratimimus]MDM1033908.1 hypothetical protein [Myroides odoratimimus]MDM1039010.1 hypothetical protein [Myroides odoratimimus]MDM1053250.1 hypothetical protein [Myroides odoratimimus]MDM1459005.1 hypothetical protein [Myroides odoratimimus]